ncbi:MAG TPA: ABC transporter permease [Acidobacteriaceae bacterium]|jgi:putative ABC transport system permease protein|nr:ABC transporter permease [Acidobacteriaceae bacterium]
MRWLDSLRMRFQMLFHRGRESARLDAELADHLDRQIAENRAAGMSPVEAREAALRGFGNPALLREQARASWSWNGLDSLARDVRIGIRTLLRTPGFALMAMLVMALGIGANVALFTLVRGVLLRPLPFDQPNRLVGIFEAESDGSYRDNVVAGGSYGVWKENAHSFSSMAIHEETEYNLAGAGNQLPEVIHAEHASASLFPLLGVQPALGRFFTAADDRPGANATVVLTWGLWKRRYGGDPAIVGHSILIDAKPYTVTGILPAWFTWPDPKIQLWTPLYHERSAELMRLFDAHNFDVIGRLRPGVTIEQATAELSALQHEIRRERPDGPVNDAVDLRSLVDAETYDVKTGLYALLGATLCLLLIACLNMANLLVARSAARSKEIAIRTALGGSRLRLLREQIVESTLLSAAGGALGLILAAGIVRWLVSTRDDMPRAYAVHMDGAVAVFALAAIAGCGLLAGLIPALTSRDSQVLTTLQESGRSHSGGRSKARLRQLLLALEVGLTVVLLVGAGLLLRSYQQLRSVHLGCATRNVLTMEMSLPRTNYSTGAARVTFFQQLLEQVRALPGVEAAGLTNRVPGEGRARDDVFTIHEHPPLPHGQVLDALTRFVDPGYFAAMQIPVLTGATFPANDRLDQAQDVVVNQALVRQYFFAGENPLDRHVDVPGIFPGKSLRIVGIVGNTRDDIAHEPWPVIYYPLFSGDQRFVTLAVRSRRDPASLALSVQKAIAGLDSTLPVADVLTMDQILGASTLDARFEATLLLAFAVLSLLLAMVGLFGVLSYMVAQRRTEIGIRIALGAQRAQILGRVLRDGLRPALWGLVLGLGASLGLTRLIASMLFGTQPLDPAVLVLVSGLLLAVAAAACLLPAWRASRLDPMQALRME